ncbi:hypothetical protein BKA66DRAFT_432380, partial [Pyrenochaeta sp. MPI-SDFR-AT-0127]
EVLKADLRNGASLEAALRGCDAAYLLTGFRSQGMYKGRSSKARILWNAAKRSSKLV